MQIRHLMNCLIPEILKPSLGLNFIPPRQPQLKRHTRNICRL